MRAGGALGHVFKKGYTVPDFEQIVVPVERSDALFDAVECGFMPIYDQMDRFRDLRRDAGYKEKLLGKILILAYKGGMVPDYDRQERLTMYPAVLKAMYKAGLKPEARHRVDPEEWYDAAYQQFLEIMATYWRRFALVRACWRKWEQCLYRPDGRAAQGAADHFKALAGGEGRAAKMRRQM